MAISETKANFAEYEWNLEFSNIVEESLRMRTNDVIYD